MVNFGAWDLNMPRNEMPAIWMITVFSLKCFYFCLSVFLSFSVLAPLPCLYFPFLSICLSTSFLLFLCFSYCLFIFWSISYFCLSLKIIQVSLKLTVICSCLCFLSLSLFVFSFLFVVLSDLSFVCIFWKCDCVKGNWCRL